MELFSANKARQSNHLTISSLFVQATQNQMCRGTKTTRQFLKIEESNFCTKRTACVHSLSEILPLKTEGNTNVLQVIRKEKYSVVVNCSLKVSLVSRY